MMIADIDVPVNVLQGAVPSFVALLFVILLLLAIWNSGKRAFGRTPPFSEEMDKRDKVIRKMIFAAEANLKEEINRAEKRTDRLEELYREMQTDRERKWLQLTSEYHGLDNKLATLTERIGNVLKRLEGK